MTFPHSSLENYRQVAEAYLGALEERLAAGRDISRIASVASFFVSRVDVPVDTLLQDRIKAAGTGAKSQLKDLEGKAAIANARLAYQEFKRLFGGPRFAALSPRGARAKQPLWASTSTKNPAYRDVLYVEELIGPDTVDTMPLKTIESFREHGKVRLSIEGRLREAKAHLAALADVGIHYDEITQQLQEEGVQSSSTPSRSWLGVLRTSARYCNRRGEGTCSLQEMRKDQHTMSTEAMQEQHKSWTQIPPAYPPLRHAIAQVAEDQMWLDKLAKPFQKWVLQLFGQPGEPQRKIKDALNGTWLGHALHPVFTDVPLGSWSGTLLLDLLWLANEDEGMARGADTTLGLGLLGAIAAALTGVADWSDLYDTDLRVGFLHGLLNGSSALTYLASWLLRLTGRRRAGVAVSAAGYLTALFSAYLGGELVFAKGTGVNHTAFEPGSDAYIAVMAVNDLAEGKLTRVDVAGIPAVLLKRGSTIYAIGATCTHQGGPLDEGTLKEGEIVQCPWHGSCFHLRDGSVINGPAVYAQPTFAVRVRQGTIELRRIDHA